MPETKCDLTDEADATAGGWLVTALHKCRRGGRRRPYANSKSAAMRWRRGLRSGDHADLRLGDMPFWPLTDGEVHYLYWFIQGSIMNVDTRWTLRRAWGLCERHAWGALAVEMAFRSDYVLGPAILYADLLERCLTMLPRAGPLRAARAHLRLRPTGACMMCTMELAWATGGAAKPERLERGRRTNALTRYALAYQPYWQTNVCRLCARQLARAAPSPMAPPCLPHLLGRGDVDAGMLRPFLECTYQHVSTLDRSFMPENTGTATPQVCASLLTAVGWFSGWRPLLILMDQTG